MKTNSLLIILLGSFCALCFASELTEDAVQEVVTTIDSSMKNKNLQGVADCLSSDVEIVSHVNFINLQGGNEINTRSKQEYIDMIKEGWDKYTHYTYNVSNVVIKISNNKALVTSDIEESATYQGRTLIANSKQKVTVEIIEGEPLVTKMVMDISVKESIRSQESTESDTIDITDIFTEVVNGIIDAVGLK